MGDIKFLAERIKHLQKLQKTAWIDKSFAEHTELNDRVLRLKQWRKELSVKQANKSFKNLSGAFKNLQPAMGNAVEQLNKTGNGIKKISAK